ncbi:hypothetical protein AALP_AA3G034500 [Arabis alpina]|uniref:H/ACA ribonucleoprotein complex subunit n=1 Tax=Arabis alpina TaxID=50452 RepID=A0A087H6S6_ARAAL|nr:hypothetical protein AALP_AA3G034500 [Arabis alpina]
MVRPPMTGGGFRGRGGRDGGGGGGRFGGGRGRFDGGGRGRGRGRFGYDEGPPEHVVEVSTFLHSCEGEAVTKLTQELIPHFNAPIYLQNKTQIGKVEEIFGPVNESMFSMKLMEGIVATSYTPGEKFYINPAKLLPLSRFFGQQKGAGGPRGGGGGRGRGRGRSSFGGGRGPPGGRGFSRGRGPPRGRGGFSRGRGRF